MKDNEPVTPAVEPTQPAPIAPIETPAPEPTPAPAVVEPTPATPTVVAEPEPAAPVEQQDTSAQDVIDRAADQAASEVPTERPLSLRERIAAASTEVELDELLAIGASDKYRFASNKTRNRWRAAAKLRRADLKGTN